MTLSSLQRSDNGHLVEEMYSTVKKKRYQIDELQQVIRELEEDNRSLRGTLESDRGAGIGPTQSLHQEIQQSLLQETQQSLHQETQQSLHQETQQSLYHETQGRKPETSATQTSSASRPQISPSLSPLDTTDLGTQIHRLHRTVGSTLFHTVLTYT